MYTYENGKCRIQRKSGIKYADIPTELKLEIELMFKTLDSMRSYNQLAYLPVMEYVKGLVRAYEIRLGYSLQNP